MTTVRPTSRGRTAADRIARTVTEAFAPAVLATAMPIVIVVHVCRTWPERIWWAGLTTLFTAAIPYGIIWLGVRRGRLTDHHIGVREQRRTPLLLGLASVVTGLLVLLLLGAPRQLVAMVAVMLAVLCGVTAANQIWKLSAHAAVSAASVTVLAIVFGWVMLAGAIIVAAIGWSRVQLRDHTVVQVAVGCVAGALLAGMTFELVR